MVLYNLAKLSKAPQAFANLRTEAPKFDTTVGEVKSISKSLRRSTKDIWDPLIPRDNLDKFSRTAYTQLTNLFEATNELKTLATETSSNDPLLGSRVLMNEGFQSLLGIITDNFSADLPLTESLTSLGQMFQNFLETSSDVLSNSDLNLIGTNIITKDAAATSLEKVETAVNLVSYHITNSEISVDRVKSVFEDNERAIESNDNPPEVVSEAERYKDFVTLEIEKFVNENINKNNKYYLQKILDSLKEGEGGEYE